MCCKNQVCLEKIEVRYDKNQGYQEKLNKGMTKIKVFQEKIEHKYKKKQGCLEKKF